MVTLYARIIWVRWMLVHPGLSARFELGSYTVVYQHNLEEFPSKVVNGFHQLLLVLNENIAHLLAWANGQHFVMLPLVSSQNNIWRMTAEIPYWWRVTTQFWLVLLVGRAARVICFKQSEALLRSGSETTSVLNFCSCSVDLISEAKWVVALQNLNCLFSGEIRL